MLEDTNQATVESADTGTQTADDSFEDIFEAPDTTEAEESQSAEAEEPQDTGTEAAVGEDTDSGDPAEQPAKIKVRHLGQDVELTMSELIANAQKGLDYDHVRQERDSLRQSPEVALIDRLAKQAGMSRADYIQAVEQRTRDQQIAAEVKRGVPEDVARRLQALEADRREREEQDRVRQIKQARNQDLMEFVKAYPDVQEFPPEVLDDISKGQKPLAAYQAYENRQLKAKLAALEKNNDNRKKTAGSLKGSGTPEEADAFLAGFDSV